MWFLDNCIWIACVKTRFYWERILFNGCQYVTKQSQDLSHSQTEFSELIFFQSGQKNMTKILPSRFEMCFGAFNILTAHQPSDTRLFSNLSNPAFCSLSFHKQIISEAHLLFQNIFNFMQILETENKIQKKFFNFGIIAFELVALNFQFYGEHILVVGCQYVNK